MLRTSTERLFYNFYCFANLIAVMSIDSLMSANAQHFEARFRLGLNLSIGKLGSFDSCYTYRP